MPRDVTVTLDDGTSIVYKNTPDEVTPEAVTARAQKETGKTVKQIDGGKAGNSWSLKSLWDDLARGGSSMYAMLADAGKNNPEDAQVRAAVNPHLPAGNQIPEPSPDAAQKSVATAFPRPAPGVDSTGRQYTRAILESLGGTATMPGPGTFGVKVAGAVGGGAGSEAAAQTLGEGPASRFLGGLAGGFAGGAGAAKLSSTRPQVSTVAREAMEGISDQQLSAAQQMQQQAAKMGVQLDLAQALTATGVDPKNLKTIRDLLANTKQGNKTQELLRNQPADVNEAVRFETAKVPGVDYGLPQAGNNVQEASTKAVTTAKSDRSAAVRGDYAAAGDLNPKVRQDFADAIMEAITKPGATPDVVAAGQKALAQLKAAPSTQAAMSHALDYDTLIGSLTGPFKGTPLSPADPKTQGQIKALATTLNGILKSSSPELASAESKFAQISNDVVNPLKQGPVGQMATQRGYTADKAAAQTKLVSFFDAGVSPSAPVSPIRTLGKELNKVDPEAFRDGFKSWLVDKIEKHAASDLTPGQAQPTDLASGLYEDLFRQPKRMQGIKDAVSVIAQQSGTNPADAVKGVEQLATMIKGAANRPASVRGMSPEQLQDMAGHSLSANTLRIFGFLPFERAAVGLERSAAGKTFRTFDELLTSPEGAATLAKLGKTPVMSEGAKQLLLGFEQGTMQGNGGAQRLDEKTPASMRQ